VVRLLKHERRKECYIDDLFPDRPSPRCQVLPALHPASLEDLASSHTGHSGPKSRHSGPLAPGSAQRAAKSLLVVRLDHEGAAALSGRQGLPQRGQHDSCGIRRMSNMIQYVFIRRRQCARITAERHVPAKEAQRLFNAPPAEPTNSDCNVAGLATRTGALGNVVLGMVTRVARICAEQRTVVARIDMYHTRFVLWRRSARSVSVGTKMAQETGRIEMCDGRGQCAAGIRAGGVVESSRCLCSRGSAGDEKIGPAARPLAAHCRY
jgi:hypothetical protein